MIVKSEEPSATRACVRKPAACSVLSRSNPIIAPRTIATPRRSKSAGNEIIVSVPLPSMIASYPFTIALYGKRQFDWTVFARQNTTKQIRGGKIRSNCLQEKLYRKWSWGSELLSGLRQIFNFYVYITLFDSHSQSLHKLSYSGKAARRIFLQCPHNNLLDLRWKLYSPGFERGRRGKQMVMCNLIERARERPVTSEPFIYDNPQRILIAAAPWFPLQLLRGSIRHGPLKIAEFRVDRGQAVGNNSDAKVAEHHSIIGRQKHIMWFHVSVDEITLVNVIQSIRDLPGIMEYHIEVEASPFGMAFA